MVNRIPAPELPMTQPQSLWTCELPCQEGFADAEDLEMRDVPGSRWAQRHPGVLTGGRWGSEGRPKGTKGGRHQHQEGQGRDSPRAATSNAPPNPVPDTVRLGLKSC